MKHPNDFVGIAWVKGGHSIDGADCWGLTTMVLRECYNIIITKFVGSKYDGFELANIMNQTLNNGQYKLTTHTPSKGSICVMYSKGTKRPEHMGVYIGELKVIHSMGGVKAGVSRIDNIQMLKRLYQKIEFYNYE